jgi:glutamate/tyrosine decarboxylase-like PLP-dependent enzyme
MLSMFLSCTECKRVILDGSPVLNLASFVHVWMPEEANKLMAENMSKNLIGEFKVYRFDTLHTNARIDSDEYPATRECLQ